MTNYIWDDINKIPIPTEQYIFTATGLAPSSYGTTVDERDEAIKTACITVKALLEQRLTQDSKTVLAYRLKTQAEAVAEFARLVGICIQCFLRGTLATDIFSSGEAQVPQVLSYAVESSILSHKRYAPDLVYRAFAEN